MGANNNVRERTFILDNLKNIVKSINLSSNSFEINGFHINEVSIGIVEYLKRNLTSGNILNNNITFLTFPFYDINIGQLQIISNGTYHHRLSNSTIQQSGLDNNGVAIGQVVEILINYVLTNQ